MNSSFLYATITIVLYFLIVTVVYYFSFNEGRRGKLPDAKTKIPMPRQETEEDRIKKLEDSFLIVSVKTEEDLDILFRY